MILRVVRGAIASTVVMAAVAAITTPRPLLGQAAVTEQTWRGPNVDATTAALFQCLYDRKWPCKVLEAGAPTIDQILNRYEQALGGKAALAKVKTRVLLQRRFQDIGTPEDELLIRYVKDPEAPGGRLRSIMSDSALDGTFLRWVNGCDAKGGFSWSGRKDASGIPHEAKNSTDGICEQQLYYYGYFPLDVGRMKSAYQRMEYRGTVKVLQPDAGTSGKLAAGEGPDIIPPGQARNAYMVLGVPAKATDEYQWLYFDTETGLLIRFASAGNNPNWPNSPLDNRASSTALSPPGEAVRIVDLLQYRKVGDGTIAPFQFVNQGPETRVRGVVMKMLENTMVPDEIFRRPKNSLRSDKGFN